MTKHYIKAKTAKKIQKEKKRYNGTCNDFWRDFMSKAKDERQDDQFREPSVNRSRSCG